MEEQQREELKDLEQPEERQSAYTPRPAWQVWLARIGVIIMLICVALYYWHIASGGMR